MNKKVSLCLSVMMLVLTGCSSTTTNTSSQTSTPTSEVVMTNEPVVEDEKALIVYFSATGHTEQVVQYIEAETDADIFMIEPSDPYTSEDLNYNDSSSRVNQEHENEDLQDVSLSMETPENWESYSTIYLGYPIWWGGAAWPVTSFVKKNDFSDKTVIPFCTSASSPLGSSAEDLAQAAGTGSWLEGQRFSSSVSENEVMAWIASLNDN